LGSSAGAGHRTSPKVLRSAVIASGRGDLRPLSHHGRNVWSAERDLPDAGWRGDIISVIVADHVDIDEEQPAPLQPGPSRANLCRGQGRFRFAADT
jgi:hypothetical protein